MIDAFEDPERVGTEFASARDRRAARLAALNASGAPARRAAVGTLRALPSEPPAPPSGSLAAAAAEEPPRASAQVGEDVYFGYARLGFVAALALALVWLWMRARSTTSRERA